MSSHKYASLIGVPYHEKSCYQIVQEFYRLEFGAELQSYYEELPENRDITKGLIYSSMRDFDNVTHDARKFGDIVLLKLYGVESHIGVYVGEGTILHTTIHSGCVIDRLSRWEKLIVGFYRVKKNDSTS